MNKRTLFLIFVNLVAAVSLYPLALAIVVAADYQMGLGEFNTALWEESKRGTLKQVISDWLQALPWALGLWLILRSLKALSHGSVARFGGIFAGLLTLTFLCVFAAFAQPAIPLLLGAMLAVGLVLVLLEALLARCLS